MKQRKAHNAILGGQLSAIAMASIVTLMCVVQSIDPVIILKRAVIASLIVGIVIAVLFQCLDHLASARR